MIVLLYASALLGRLDRSDTTTAQKTHMKQPNACVLFPGFNTFGHGAERDEFPFTGQVRPNLSKHLQLLCTRIYSRYSHETTGTLKSGASQGHECLSWIPQRNKSGDIIGGEEKHDTYHFPPIKSILFYAQDNKV
uniref:SFRICE_038434 n=1 Tax=Spodoptera frugiperda TaxID=7108 RepID=A0A2H1VRH2_SPOFR